LLLPIFEPSAVSRLQEGAQSLAAEVLDAVLPTGEFDFLWEEVKHKLVGYDLVYARVLKYNRGCFIQPHTDSYNQGQQQSDYSCIIQLNDPDTYRGGLPSIDTRLFYLEQGDALVYSYDETHGVEPVQKGIRYVVNLRLKKVK
jgi:predicted 2-oxoglutarate/Fe(II)-dependent dioxygenase YbiX